uniref:Uncharacterized protein n=1 Tax=Arundo donax TaxID=35708 RepID=A0A0A8YNZ7_ARUDO
MRSLLAALTLRPGQVVGVRPRRRAMASAMKKCVDPESTRACCDEKVRGPRIHKGVLLGTLERCRQMHCAAGIDAG